jgi:ATP-dependent DNA ligase
LVIRPESQLGFQLSCVWLRSSRLKFPRLPPSRPSGSGWIHEIKHDGFRTMVAIDGGKARAFTRNGYDWTARYTPVIKACASLACRSLKTGEREASR